MDTKFTQKQLKFIFSTHQRSSRNKEMVSCFLKIFFENGLTENFRTTTYRFVDMIYIDSENCFRNLSVFDMCRRQLVSPI